MSEHGLSIWTIYRKPFDYPDKFVARRFVVAAGVSGPTDDVLTADRQQDLFTAVRERLAGEGVKGYWLPRQPGDDPAIQGVIL